MALHPIEVTFRITSHMDFLHKRFHVWDKDLYARIEGCIYVLQQKKVVFDTPLMEAIAEGDDAHHLVAALLKRFPRTAKELNAALDELYDIALPPAMV